MKTNAVNSHAGSYRPQPLAARNGAAPARSKQDRKPRIEVDLNSNRPPWAAQSSKMPGAKMPPAPETVPKQPDAGEKRRVPPKTREVAKKPPAMPKKPTSGKPTAKRQTGAARPNGSNKGSNKGSKKEKVLALLRRAQGATLAEMTRATGWQSHSVRGFLSGVLTRKMGLKVKSGKRDDGERVYSIR